MRAVLFDLGGTLWMSWGTEGREAVLKKAVMEDLGENPALVRGLERLDERLTRPNKVVKDLLRASGSSADDFASEDLREIDLVQVVRESFDTEGLGSPSNEEVERMAHYLSGHYVLFPETLEVLDALKKAGLVVGIVSNTAIPPAIMQKYVDESGIGRFLDFALYSSGVGYRKPHPAIYRRAMEEIEKVLGYSVSPKDVMFVGDRPVEDVLGPAVLGLKTALVRYLEDVPDYLKTMGKPDAVLPDLSRLREILLG